MGFKQHKFIIFTVFFVAFSCEVIAKPTIDYIEHDGAFVPGNTIVISGDSFREGPNIVIFDDFSRGADGESITTDATVGTWDSVSSNAVYIDDDSGTDNLGAHLIEGCSMRQLRVFFPKDISMFMSYRVKIPEGYTFPGTDQAETFSIGSHWKVTWLIGEDYDSSGNNMCIPTFVSSFRIGGNSPSLAYYGEDNWPDRIRAFREDGSRFGDDWWTFNGWNRGSFLIISDEKDPGGAPGYYWHQAINPEQGQTWFELNDRSFHGLEEYWKQFNIPGWVVTNVDRCFESTRVIYDDIYLAVGANSAARVEIGDSPIYTESKEIAIFTIDSWSDDQINATVRQGGFKIGDEVFLFVIDADNNVSDGYPVRLGSENPIPSVENFRILNN